MAYGPKFETLTDDQKKAVELFVDSLRQRFPEAAGNVTADEQFGSVALKLGGIGAGRIGEVESGMSDVQTDIMLSTGVLLMLMPD